MNKEDLFIKELSNTKLIGDDGAFIDGFVYSKDAFCEDIHFKRSWFSLEEIAYKALSINVSDAIVSNAIPLYGLLYVGIPKNYTNNEIKTLANAFKKAFAYFNIKLIGGDTISNNKLDISISLISKCKNHISRRKLKIGDYLAYTGEIGASLKDLNRLLRGLSINKNSKFIKPILKADFFYKIAPLINSAMDISDGLSRDLAKLSLANKVNFNFLKKINKNILESGEEYEILFAFSPKYKRKILNLARKYKVNVNIFAKAIRGRYKNFSKAHHFE